MAASVELGDSLEELEELFLKDIKACEQALPRGAGGRAGRGRGTKKRPRCNFRPKRCKCLNAFEKNLYGTNSRVLIRLFPPCCNISHNVDCLSNYLLNSSVTKNSQKPLNRSSRIHRYNTRSSAMGNYYVSESRLSLQLSLLPTLERGYGTLFILTGARL